MDNKEHMKILKMLEQGKITSEEAVKLMEASKNNGINEFISDSGKNIKRAYKKVEPTLKETANNFVEGTISVFRKIRNKFDK